MKRERRQKLLGVSLLLVWMLVIFGFSAQPAEQSGQTSDGICYRIVLAVRYIARADWSVAKMETYAQGLSLPVRKIAHMTEYAILTMLATWNIRMWGKQHYRFLAILFAVCYAMTDEFHQTFVSGRSGNIADVCIDGIGACIGAFILFLIFRRRKESK